MYRYKKTLVLILVLLVITSIILGSCLYLSNIERCKLTKENSMLLQTINKMSEEIVHLERNIGVRVQSTDVYIGNARDFLTDEALVQFTTCRFKQS